MSDFTKELYIKMLTLAADKIAEEHEGLSKLDAATGDGDHGVTIHRTMKAVKEAAAAASEKPLADLAKDVAMKVMMCDGGSTSPLLGSYIMGFGNAAPADTLNAEQTACFFEAALTNFFGISKAELGDKTMMDAMRPATETLAKELRAGSDLTKSFNAAAQAAAEGAEKTKDYVAKFGRARTMGERAIGHQDAGATSISYIWGAFAQACNG
ncbi:MAG: dihydroxyacetone kinase subunit L [Planctomycetes bacterium]|nr:dihydroxyacetone kinase subunit L [Planctomycetota bacterium]